jgi:uncharacterized protein GlcG (DUF336 family)
MTATSAEQTSTFEKRSISLGGARRVIEAAEVEAVSLGLAVSVAVVDDSGVIKAFGRMDGSALINVQSSQDKAYTAVGMGMGTHKWYPIIKDDPALLAGVVGAIDRLVIFGGGIPIRIGGHVVGAVGVGGGTHLQDRQIAETGARAVGGHI